MWLWIRGGCGGRFGGGGGRLRSCAAALLRHNTTAPSTHCWVAGQTWTLCTAAARPTLNVCDVEAAVMLEPTRRHRTACLDLDRTTTMQGHHVTRGSQSRELHYCIRTFRPFFFPSSSINLSLSLQTIIRRAEICETERKWQNWNPAPATHGAIKGSGGPASTRPLFEQICLFQSFSHKTLRQISFEKKKCPISRVTKKIHISLMIQFWKKSA